jgi:flagellar FliL protein
MKLIRNSLLLIFATFSLLAHAEDSAEAQSDEVIYVDLKPSFVANYQSHKMGYLKTDITLKVKGGATAEAVDRHIPAIRHNLVMLFSSQTADNLNTMEGKQQLKSNALTEVLTALQDEGEAAQVEEILFTSFIVD